jgi:hypothetical protein
MSCDIAREVSWRNSIIYFIEHVDLILF